MNDLITRDPTGTHRDAVSFCTEGKIPPAEVLAYLVRRWSLEPTSAEVRAHPGMETQRQWSDLAITRTTPVLMGLFSVVSVLAVRWHGQGGLAVSGSAWYAKGEPTFSDCLAQGRQKFWRSQNQTGSLADGDRLELPNPLWEAVIQCLSRAA